MSALKVLSLLLLSTVAGQASAQAGARVELTGSVDAGTCSVAAVSRTLPPVGADAFPQVAGSPGGVPASYTDFEISLANCSGVTGAVFMLGTPADASSAQANIFRNTAANPAPFTGYWLKEGTGRCASGTTVGPGGTVTKNFTSATYQLYLCAQYAKVAGGLVTMGPLSTNFTVTITYR
jgi:type 1 fimbria pilin